MKSKFHLSIAGVVLFIFLFGFAFAEKRQSVIAIAATKQDSLPVLPYQPSINNGWVGQYVCYKKVNSTGHKPAPFSYFTSVNNLHSGFVELRTKIKAAIRTNMPDKNNPQRWESWITNGRTKSWNYVNDSLHAITVITSDNCCRTPHNHFYTVKSGSEYNLTVGETSPADLQIDWQTGTFILSLPTVSYKAATWEKWNVYGKKLNNYIRVKEESDDKKEFNMIKFGINSMDTIMGRISAEQRTIVIERTIINTLKYYLFHNNAMNEVCITPHPKEQVIFKLILNRVGE